MKSALIALLFSHSVSALAQEATQLEPIVVNEDRASVDKTIIRSNEIDKKQAEDLEDVFRTAPDITVGGAQSAAQKVYVRGIEDTNLNITIDGARQGGYLFHHQGRFSVDPELLKRVEVEAGTGDALSGPGALGGAVQFETKEVEDLLPAERVLGAYLKAGYASAADEKTLSASVFGRPSDNTGLLFYFKGAETIDYRVGGGDRQAFTSSHPRSALGKFTFRPSETQKITLSSTLVRDNARRTQRAHFGLSANNLPNDQEFETLSNSLRYQADSANPLLDLEIDLYDSKTSIAIRRDNGTSSNANVRSSGVKAQNAFTLGDFDLAVGADANRDRSEAQGTGAQQTETGTILGVFAQGQYALAPSWILESGARFDSYSLIDVAGNELKKSRLNPNAAVVHRLNQNFDTRLSWSQAFRGPTPMETLLIANAVTAAPVGDLEGTVADTTALTFAYRLGNSKSELALYSTRLHQLIESRVANNSVIRENGKDVVSRGFTLSTIYDLSSWALRGAFAHNDVDFGNEPIGYTGTSFGRGASFGDRLTVGVDYRLAETGVIMSLESLLVFPMRRVPTGATQQPGYNVQDFTVEWYATETMRLGFAIANIFDVKYVAQGTPFVGDAGRNSMFEPGRDIRFSASATF